MNILIVSQYFWPESFRINELAKSLTEEGHSVEILTGKPNYPDGKIYPGYRGWGVSHEDYGGCKIHRVPLIARGQNAFLLTLNYLSFILSGLIIGPWLLRGKQFDVIFVFGVSPILQAIPALLLGRLKKCPVQIWVQDLWPESLSATGYITNKYILKMVEMSVCWIYRRADTIFVQSKAFIDRVQAMAGDTPVIYYPNSFIEQDETSSGYDLQCEALDSGFPVVFAGNLGHAQAVDVIVDAAEILRDIPDINFVMAGDGSQMEWMVEEMQRRQLSNIAFTGRLPLEAMPELMSRASSLLVILRDREIFRLTIPSKVQAYLASGNPIIASLNGAGAELVEEANAGIASAAEDPQALADAIKKMYNMSDAERDEMGRNGRDYYVENFAPDKLVKQLSGYMHAAIEEYRRNSH